MPPRPNLTVSLEALYHHLPLSLVLTGVVSDDLFLIGIILTDPLQTPLDEAFPKLRSSARGESPVLSPKVDHVLRPRRDSPTNSLRAAEGRTLDATI
jgi:hypothetical protein